MKKIIYNHKTFFIPGSWNELTRKQLLLYCKLLLNGKMEGKSKGSQVFIRMNLIKAFTGMTWLEYWDISKKEREEVLNPTLDFLFKDCALTRNKLPLLRSGFSVFSGPEEGLNKVRALEFTFADGFFLRYSKTGKVEYLDKLIAVLYRPRKASRLIKSVDYDGDMRVKFNQKHADSRIKWASNLKPEIKHAIYLFYLGSRFEQERLNPEMFTDSVTNKVNKLGFIEVINEMAGAKFGTIDETEKTLVVKIFREICRNIRNQNPA